MADKTLNDHLGTLGKVRERADRYAATGALNFVPTNASRAAHDRSMLVEVCDALLSELARLRKGAPRG